MIIRYDDDASDLEKAELKFHIRNIFATKRVGTLAAVRVKLTYEFFADECEPSCRAENKICSEWEITIPAIWSGEFVCTRAKVLSDPALAPEARFRGSEIRLLQAV